MNVLFLGNGFDLFHKLPTKYINFLNTVDFLSSQDVSKISTVGEVFSNKALSDRDKEIQESYSKYGDTYDSIAIDTMILDQLKGLSNNLWYKYFLKTLKSDINWIDFEKGIFEVIQSFQQFFSLPIRSNVSLGKLDEGCRYIIKAFDFFLNPSTGNEIPTSANPIKPEYLIANPVGSKNITINKSQIIKDLFKQLNEIAEALKVYLKYFIEKMVEKVPAAQNLPWEDAFQYTEYVLTFNYTNTYELLYKKTAVTHIHGNVDAKIVLGVNPDNFDNIETVDTTFIPFKKYFQRVKHKTDIQYLEFIENNKKSLDLTLYIIGHSLDITDKDIIQEVFSVANKIFILSYDEIDESKHITNLINIFGKSDFDKMRREKDISFISIFDDIKDAMRIHNEGEKLKKHLNALSSFRNGL